MDFEQELVDRSHRSFINQMRKQILWRAVVMGVLIFFVGALSPNFFSLANEPLQYQIARADFEDQYAESILLQIDGFLTKTYVPTENSKGGKGIQMVEVESGDTLYSIAKRYGVKESDIIVNNNLSLYDIKRLRLGAELKIANGIIHKVGSKETISSIATLYGVDQDKLIQHNEIKGKELKAGMEIVVADAKKNLPAYTTPSSGLGDNWKGSTSIADRGGKLHFPTDGKYTQFYNPGHYAVDIANNQSPPVYAAEAGVVEKSQCGWNGGYGCHIVINHGNGMKTLYAHNRDLYVTVGENVARGQRIARMGRTGRVYGKTGIHLHFEVTVDGIKRNPVIFF
ncbi:MAG: peptidoglycan DD-metalloendopeptidase family protein [bacterium]|nr:peptidoglycan DD-metalloendopeptidase family protein [bacterium]